jgi:cytochrome c biogenesis protein CcmG, thiol:disulfide interchange protein DsbE
MNNRIVWAVVAAGLVIVIAGIAFAGTLGSDPTLVDSPLIGRPAPDVTLGEFGDDGSVTTGDHAGDVLVVNFWASWCVGCRDEHAALLAASEAYDEFGVTFLGINSQDEPGSASAFLDELGRGSSYEYAVDESSRAAFAYGVHGMPETFFIDRDGIVVGKVAGPVTYDLLAATIETMLFER